MFNTIKYLIIIAIITLYSSNLHSQEMKVYEFDNFNIDIIENGPNNQYYSISENGMVFDISYSVNGFQNLKLKYKDSTLIVGGVLVKRPPRPYSIKYYENYVYIGYDFSMLVKFDLELNPVDTFFIEKSIQIIDKIFVSNGKIVVSTKSMDINDNYRLLFTLDNNNLNELKHPNYNPIHSESKIKVYRESELYYITFSFQLIENKTVFKPILYSTTNLGLKWDSLDIPDKYNKKDLYLIEIFKIDENQYWGNAQYEKYPDTTDYLRNIRVIYKYNSLENKFNEFKELEGNNNYGLGYNLFNNDKYKITYFSTKLLVQSINNNYKLIDFRDYLSEIPYLGKLSILVVTEDKLLLSGNTNKIIEINLDLLLSVSGNLQSSNLIIFPNPSAEKISLDLDGVAIADLVVYDILGNETMSIQNYTNKSEIDISSLSKGTYLIKIQHGNNTKTVKVVVN